jgi:hypothetical protein
MLIPSSGLKWRCWDVVCATYVRLVGGEAEGVSQSDMRHMGKRAPGQK